MNIPLFPNFKPKLILPAFFEVDQPCDDEDEVSQLERDHQNWLNQISTFNSDITPIGKTASENQEEDEEEDDEDDNDDDEESESHEEEEEDEIEMDVSQERSSPDVSIRLVQGHGLIMEEVKTESNASLEQPQKVTDFVKSVEITPTVLDSPKTLETQSERVVHHQSDIFSANDKIESCQNIFSVNGAPSRRLYRARPMTSTIFDDKISPPIERFETQPKKVEIEKKVVKRPSSALRNPLTGLGLSSIDEFKPYSGSRRKDGNPLLGTGYASETQVPNCGRMPPGGYSHKLW